MRFIPAPPSAEPRKKQRILNRVGRRTVQDFTLWVSLRQDFSCLDLNQPSGALRCRFNVPDGWVHLRLQFFDVRRLICLGSHGKLLTHPHSPQLSSSRPRRRRAVHFSRLFTGECESSRLLFLGCEANPHGWLRDPESKFLET